MPTVRAPLCNRANGQEDKASLPRSAGGLQEQGDRDEAAAASNWKRRQAKIHSMSASTGCRCPWQEPSYARQSL